MNDGHAAPRSGGAPELAELRRRFGEWRLWLHLRLAAKAFPLIYANPKGNRKNSEAVEVLGDYLAMREAGAPGAESFLGTWVGRKIEGGDYAAIRRLADLAKALQDWKENESTQIPQPDPITRAFIDAMEDLLERGEMPDADTLRRTVLAAPELEYNPTHPNWLAWLKGKGWGDIPTRRGQPWRPERRDW